MNNPNSWGVVVGESIQLNNATIYKIIDSTTGDIVYVTVGNSQNNPTGIAVVKDQR